MADPVQEWQQLGSSKLITGLTHRHFAALLDFSKHIFEPLKKCASTSIGLWPALQFASKVVEAYTDCQLWSKLVEGGYRNLEQHFSPEVAKPILMQASGLRILYPASNAYIRFPLSPRTTHLCMCLLCPVTRMHVKRCCI